MNVALGAPLDIAHGLATPGTPLDKLLATGLFLSMGTAGAAGFEPGLRFLQRTPGAGSALIRTGAGAVAGGAIAPEGERLEGAAIGGAVGLGARRAFQAARGLDEFGFARFGSSAPAPIGVVQTGKENIVQQFLNARSRTSRPGFLSPLSGEDMIGARVYLSEDGTVGYILRPNGHLENLFNNGGPRGAGSAAVQQALSQGAKTLDAFDGFLPDFYRQHGFVETGRIKFNREYAPPGWSYAKDGEPDVVFMAYRPDLKGKVGKSQRYFDDWDEAMDVVQNTAREPVVAEPSILPTDEQILGLTPGRPFPEVPYSEVAAGAEARLAQSQRAGVRPEPLLPERPLPQRADPTPPPMGSTPLREGYVRLFHQTPVENAQSIRTEGLRVDKARGPEGPLGIWTAEDPFYGNAPGLATVEIQVPAKDVPEGRLPFKRDIKPEEIIGVHEPWHERYRYLKDNGLEHEVRAGQHDDLLDSPDYGPAIRAIKAEGEFPPSSVESVLEAGKAAQARLQALGLSHDPSPTERAAERLLALRQQAGETGGPITESKVFGRLTPEDQRLLLERGELERRARRPGPGEPPAPALRPDVPPPPPGLRPQSAAGRRALEHIQPDEVAHFTKKDFARLDEVAKELEQARAQPLIEAAVVLGKLGRGFYGHAIEVITDMFGPQAPRFTALLASMSPKAPVDRNVKEALRVWEKWQKLGGESADPQKVLQMLQADKAMKTLHPNMIEALLSPVETMLSGPKVENFRLNLSRMFPDRITLDTHMSKIVRWEAERLGGKNAPKALRDALGRKTLRVRDADYIAFEGMVRRVANQMGLEGREAQEMAWQYLRERGIVVERDLVERGLLKASPRTLRALDAPVDTRGFGEILQPGSQRTILPFDAPTPPAKDIKQIDRNVAQWLLDLKRSREGVVGGLRPLTTIIGGGVGATTGANLSEDDQKLLGLTGGALAGAALGALAGGRRFSGGVQVPGLISQLRNERGALGFSVPHHRDHLRSRLHDAIAADPFGGKEPKTLEQWIARIRKGGGGKAGYSKTEAEAVIEQIKRFYGNKLSTRVRRDELLEELPGIPLTVGHASAFEAWKPRWLNRLASLRGVDDPRYLDVSYGERVWRHPEVDYWGHYTVSGELGGGPFAHTRYAKVEGARGNEHAVYEIQSDLATAIRKGEQGDLVEGVLTLPKKEVVARKAEAQRLTQAGEEARQESVAAFDRMMNTLRGIEADMAGSGIVEPTPGRELRRRVNAAIDFKRLARDADVLLDKVPVSDWQAPGVLLDAKRLSKDLDAYTQAVDKWHALGDQLREVRRGLDRMVPEVPGFTTSSSYDWIQLPMKGELLAAASDPSVTRFSWSTGNTATDMFNLRHVVDEIGVELDDALEEGAERLWFFKPKNGDLQERLWDDKEAIKNVGEDVFNAVMKAAKQEENNIAFKRVTSEEIGQAIEVGKQAKGMRAFYDGVVKDWMKAYLKQLNGGKEVPINGGTNRWWFRMTPELREAIIKGQAIMGVGGVAAGAAALSEEDQLLLNPR